MSKTKQIDFDEWAALARSNPEAFEAKRRKTVNDFIASLPESRQAHLRRLQWRIDGVRHRARTPLAACIRLSNMMWESVYGNGGLLEELRKFQGVASPSREPHSRATNARVLAFPASRPRP